MRASNLAKALQRKASVPQFRKVWERLQSNLISNYQNCKRDRFRFLEIPRNSIRMFLHLKQMKAKYP